MSKSFVIDKLNLHPKSAFYNRNKGDINVGTRVLTQEISSLIPPQYDGNPSSFPSPLRGINPFSAQKFYSKRTATSSGQIIFAKIPFVDSTNNTTLFTKPYRTGFECDIYFQHQDPSKYLSLVLRVEGSIPTTQNQDLTQITTATNLSLIVENTGDFEVSYFPLNPSSEIFTFIDGFYSSFLFFVGRDPSAESFFDNEVNTSDTNFLYLGGTVNGVSQILPMVIKTIFTYI